MGITGPVPVVKHADTKIEIAKIGKPVLYLRVLPPGLIFRGQGRGEIQINEGERTGESPNPVLLYT